MDGFGPMMVLTIAAGFLVGFSLILAVRAYVVSRGSVLQDRLAQVAMLGGRRTTVTRDDESTPALAVVERMLSPSDGDSHGQLRQRLIWAGYRGPRAMQRYFGTKVALTIALGTAVLLIDAFTLVPRAQIIAALLLAAVAGFHLPTLALQRRIERRQASIRRSLPDALDLLVSCVEAGLSLDSALGRVAPDFELAAPTLSAKLMTTRREIEAGLPRAECFRRLAGRNGVTELHSLAAVLVQTQMFGTGVGVALRVLANALRVDRMQKANERAFTVAVRLAFPLVLCLMPALFLLLTGGAVIRIGRSLLPVMTGGGM